MSATDSAASAARTLHPVESEQESAQEVASGIAKLYERRFTREDQDVFETVEWAKRDARAGDFEQLGVEAPVSWSDQSVAIVAKLYFATVDGVREQSIRQPITRVVSTYTREMTRLGYFGMDIDGCTAAASIFFDELAYAILHQYVTFNSPVWFNIGVPGRKPATSACFLLSVQDKMLGPDSITDWWAKEAAIFKSGAGTGINLSTLRGSMEPLSTGGSASGPVAYMRPADAGAGTLKSGGAHRRAAKFVRLDSDHPDILDFVRCKVREDERVQILREAGVNLDPSTPDGERNLAEATSFQNQNISVGATDEFMRKAIGEDPDSTWPLIGRVSGEVVETISAPELLQEIAEAAWRCADPGMQFHDTINLWHTTPSVGPINTSNVCGEILEPDDCACNLASLNLLRYVLDDGFATGDFRYHVDLLVSAMDASCSFSSLPTERIERNVRRLRHLGLGYSNLGAALMAQGLPYESDEGRDFAAAVTALMTSRAYRRSALLADHLGPFAGYEDDQDAMLGVIARHQSMITPFEVSTLWEAVRQEWRTARELGREHGYRNALVTTVQPGGTTSFMMGCDTTGVEPAFSLVTHKSLAGGGTMTMLCGCVERALHRLGYGERVAEIMEAVATGDDSWLDMIDSKHQMVFQTAVGVNTVSPDGHVRMVAAIQPHLSQGISKTVNVPNWVTPQDIRDVYVQAWRLGCKSISVYRDGSKATQVLRSATKVSDQPEIIVTDEVKSKLSAELPIVLPSPQAPQRRRMPQQRQAHVVKFVIDGHEGYLTIGLYEDGTVGEIFLNGIGKDGSTLRGMADAWATDFSIALQYGVPLETLVRKHAHVRFPPEGATNDPDVPIASSIPDFVARKVAAMFLDVDACEELGVLSAPVKERMAARYSTTHTGAGMETITMTQTFTEQTTVAFDVGEACRECGASMERTGSCWRCPQCFNTTGCG